MTTAHAGRRQLAQPGRALVARVLGDDHQADAARAAGVRGSANASQKPGAGAAARRQEGEQRRRPGPGHADVHASPASVTPETSCAARRRARRGAPVADPRSAAARPGGAGSRRGCAGARRPAATSSTSRSVSTATTRGHSATAAPAAQPGVGRSGGAVHQAGRLVAAGAVVDEDVAGALAAGTGGTGSCT